MKRRSIVRMVGAFALALPLVTSAAVTAEAASPGVLMVTATSSGTRDDRAVAAELTTAGFAVTIVDDNAVNTADALDYEAVLVSSTAAASTLDSTFTDVAVPVVNYEYLLHDDLGLTQGGGANRGELGGQVAIDIVDPSHPVIDNAATGEIDVFTKFSRVTWGRPGPAARVAATVVGDAQRAALFTYDSGDALANGDVAPARRAGVFVSAASDGYLLPVGFALLVATLNWAIDADPPSPGENQPPTVDAGPDVTTTHATVVVAGSATDDGLPAESTLTTGWSGPSGVTFGDATSLTTSVTLPGAGTYQLTLTASDTELDADDTVTITVADEPDPDPDPGPGFVGPVEVLMVTATASGTGDDQGIAAALADAGFSVSITNDNSVTAAEAETHDVVIITSTATQSAVGTRLTDAAVPIINYEHLLQDDLGLTPNGSSNRNEQGGQQAIDIVDTAHPIINGAYSDNVDVFTKFTRSTWGKPAAAADVVATIPGVPSRSTLYTYDAGDILANGDPAPARRAGIFITAAGDGNLSVAGQAILNNTVNWSLLDRNAAPTVAAGADATFPVDGSTVLQGSFDDDALPVGSARSVSWAGPVGVQFSDPASATTVVTAAAVGVYELTISVDDGFLSGDDTVTITVTEAGGGGGGPTPLTFGIESMDDGDIPTPPTGSIDDQTGLIVADLDNDGRDDLVVYGRAGANSVQWFRRTGNGQWQIDIIDSTDLTLEAGGVAGDVDGDGDLDLVVGSDFQDNEIWWWQNPGPTFTPGTDWTRRELLTTGGNRHHDLAFGDVDGDGRPELVSWTQGRAADRVDELYVTEIPADPTLPGDWPTTLIHDAAVRSEGVALADIDGNGVLDIVAGGNWFAYDNGSYTVEAFSPNSETTVAIGQIVPGGRPEIVLSAGDVIGDLELISWDGAQWASTSLLGGAASIAAPWNRGHSVDLGDVDGDGHLDLFSAEMYLPDVSDSAGAAARSVLLLGDGTGAFTLESITTGSDNHESGFADVDGDGDLDIVDKPFDFGIPGLSVRINGGVPPAIGLDAWTKHVIDIKPDRAMFIIDADVDGDGDQDLVTGGWWYENTGSMSGWVRRTIGSPLLDALAVEDLDGDGDLDIFGAQGPAGQAPKPRQFAWAENDGAGSFSVRTNIDSGSSSFIQGIDTARLSPSGPMEIWLSWNERSNLVQKIVVPPNPTVDQWTLQTANAVSQGEQIEFVDIDADGDLDLLEGHLWLENTGSDTTTWPDHEIHNPTNCCFAGVIDTLPLPDRVVAADVNGDGRIDAVVSHEYDPSNRVVWYEQPADDPTQLWTEHVIGSAATAIHSVDVADLDGDGDLDVVAGEHRRTDEVIENGQAWVFENLGAGATWTSHLFDGADAHHDGTQLADLDADGDLDIFSIGWEHNRVMVYENINDGDPPEPDTTPPVLAGVSADPSVTSALVTWSTDEAADSQVEHGTDPTYGTITSSAGFTTSHSFLIIGLTCDTLYHYRVTSTDRSDNASSSSDATFTTGPCGSDLLVHLTMDDATGTTASDSSGNGNAGALVNGASFEATTIDDSASSVRLDGNDDAVELGNLDVTGSGITLATRFRADSFPGPSQDPRLISKATGTAADQHIFMLSTITDGGGVRLRARLRINGSTTTLIATEGDLAPATWYHAAMTYDGVDLRLHLDGVEVGSTPLSGVVDTDPQVTVTIGDQPDGAGAKAFDGLIDDVRIYQRGLTGTEVSELAGDYVDPGDPGDPGDPPVSTGGFVSNVIDGNRPHRAVFVLPGDIDGDGDGDLAAGAWWYENPGDPLQAWTRHTIGGTFQNVGAVYDFDGDGDLDLWGTSNDAPATPTPAAALYWAENDGAGSFTVHTNLATPDGNFLQGVWVGRLTTGGPLQMAVSWQARSKGVQLFTVPSDPTTGTWTWTTISTTSFGEELDAGDFDGDGDLDLHLGEVWLENDGTSSWPDHVVDPGFPAVGPDRVEVGDVDGDGQLDVVVGVSRFDLPAEVYWYEHGADPTIPWTRHTITTTAVGGAMSMDTVDFDGDGDLDVLVGEHGDEQTNPNLRLLLFLNGGDGTTWTEVTLDDTGSHHDGSQAVDLDNDGDFDVASTGWFHDRVTVYVNVSGPGSAWADNDRQYRIPLTVSAGATARINRPATVALDFGQALAGAGGTGTFDPSSLNVVQLDSSGTVVASGIRVQFEPNPGDADIGTVVVDVAGTLPAGQSRFYQLYFDVAGGPWTPVVPTAEVSLDRNGTDEGLDTLDVTTPVATYRFDPAGGGFTSIEDADGNDWIGWSTDARGAGDFRGLPNLIHPESQFHPGRTGVTTTVVAEGPLRIGLAVTAPGGWAGRWNIYADFAEFELTAAGHDYWFQYEGTPGGVFEPGVDLYVRSDGTSTTAGNSVSTDIPGNEWAMVADPNVARGFFISQDNDDTFADTYAPFEGEMSIMTFGRSELETTKLLSATPARFTVGFVDAITAAGAAPTVESSRLSFTAAAGAVASRV